MAQPTTLDLLAQVVKALGGLASVDRGTPLRSSDWNTLVSSVVTLARLVEQRERTAGERLESDFAPAQHDHTGEVDLSWFDPSTRALLEGRDAVSSAKISLAATQRDLTKLRSELALSQRAQEAFKLDLVNFGDRDAVRERTVSRLTLGQESLRDLQSNVSQLEARFNAVGGKVDEALKFRDTLGEGNEFVDLRLLRERVSSLETVADGLKTASGDVVFIRDFEQRLVLLEDNAVRKSDFDRELSGRLEAGDFVDEAGFALRVSEQITAGLEPRFEQLRAGTQTLSGDVASLRGQVDTVRGEQRAELTAMQGRVATLETASQQLPGLAGQLGALNQRLTTAELTLNNNRAAVDRVAVLDLRTTQLEQNLAGMANLPSRVQQLSEQVVAAQAGVESLREVTKDLEAVRGDVDAMQKLAREVSELRADLDRVRGERLSELDGRLQTAEAELDLLDGLGSKVNTLATSQTTLASLQTEAEARLRVAENLARAATVLSTTVDQLGTRTSELTSRAGAVDTKLNAQASAIVELTRNSQRVDTLAGQLQSVSERTTQLQQSLSATTASLQALGSRTATLENAGLVGRSELTLLADRVQNVEGNVARVTAGGVLRPAVADPAVRVPLAPR